MITPAVHLQDPDFRRSTAAACGHLVEHVTTNHVAVTCGNCKHSRHYAKWLKWYEHLTAPETVTERTVTKARDERYAEADRLISIAQAFRLRAEEYERDSLAVRAQGDRYHDMLPKETS